MARREYVREDSVDRIVAAWKAVIPDYRVEATNVYTRIQHIARFYEDAFARVAKRHTMAAGDIYVLLALRRAARQLTPTELFRELSVTAGAISKRLDRLEALGFVRRHADDSDGRSIKVELSPAGREIVDHEIVFSNDFAFRAPTELPHADREALTHHLRALLVLLESNPGLAVGPKGAFERRSDD